MKFKDHVLEESALALTLGASVLSTALTGIIIKMEKSEIDGDSPFPLLNRLYQRIRSIGAGKEFEVIANDRQLNKILKFGGPRVRESVQKRVKKIIQENPNIDKKKLSLAIDRLASQIEHKQSKN